MVGAAIIVVVIVVSIAVSALVAVRSRKKSLESKDRFDWAPSLCVVVGAIIVFVSLMVYSAYAVFLYTIFFVPLVFLACLILLVAAAIDRRPRQCLLMLLTLALFWVLLGLCSRMSAQSGLRSDGYCGRTASRLKFWRSLLQLAEN